MILGIPEASEAAEKKFNPLELRDRRGRWYRESAKAGNINLPYSGGVSGDAASRIDPKSMPMKNLIQSAYNSEISHENRARFMDEWVRRHQENDTSDEGRTSSLEGRFNIFSPDSKLDSSEWDISEGEQGTPKHADALLNMARDVMAHDGEYSTHNAAGMLASASSEIRSGDLTWAKRSLQEARDHWLRARLGGVSSRQARHNYAEIGRAIDHHIELTDRAMQTHSDVSRIHELERELEMPAIQPSDADLRSELNQHKTLEELDDAELEAELARRRAGLVSRAAEPDIEKAGPKGYVHGWVYVGVGKDDALEDKAEKVTDNALAHRGGSTSSAAGHKEAARLHRQAANASSSDEAIAYHKQMAKLHRAVGNGKMTNAQAKAKARQVRTGSKAKPVGHAADKLNMISTMKERRSLARSLSDKELEKTDEEFQRRAKALGKEGQVSRAHQAVRDEIESRRGSKRGSSIRDSLPDEDFAGPHRSYPIVTLRDLGRAASLAHHAADPESIRQRLREIAQRKFPGKPLPPSLVSKGSSIMDDDFFTPYELVKMQISRSYAGRLEAEAAKAGPHGYVHGWIHVGGPGSSEHDRALNELGGLAANHSQEAANAVNRARTASQEGRYSAAKDHLDNAAFLLHAAGRHNLATAAEGARDSFRGATPPPAEKPPAPSGRVTGSRSAPDSAREFHAALAMSPGTAPVGSGYSMAVPGQNRMGHKSVDEYEMAKQQIMANRIAAIMAMNASRYTSTVGDRKAE